MRQILILFYNKDQRTKLGTIAGINNWNEWSWPIDGPDSGHILARALPHINEWTIITPAKIKKIEKIPITKPNPNFTTPSKATNPWLAPIPKPICKNLHMIVDLVPSYVVLKLFLLASSVDNFQNKRQKTNLVSTQTILMLSYSIYRY